MKHLEHCLVNPPGTPTHVREHQELLLEYPAEAGAVEQQRHAKDAARERATPVSEQPWNMSCSGSHVVECPSGSFRQGCGT